jgi:hypothetical protein
MLQVAPRYGAGRGRNNIPRGVWGPRRGFGGHWGRHGVILGRAGLTWGIGGLSLGLSALTWVPPGFPLDALGVICVLFGTLWASYGFPLDLLGVSSGDVLRQGQNLSETLYFAISGAPVGSRVQP